VRKLISKQSPIISFRSLFKESDRGCVLIAGTLLEETLRKLHEAHIATTIWPARKNVFKGLSQTHAPLSTFAAVIKIAFAYGLISAEDYEDLELIRGLRNEAAHTIYDFSFEDHGVQEMVMRLKADERIRRKAADSKKSPAVAEGTKLALPEITEVKRHFLLNSLALRDTILEKLVNTVELLLTKRKAERHKGAVDSRR
jgi:DNA-binding MltR family transcriptional regulator